MQVVQLLSIIVIVVVAGGLAIAGPLFSLSSGTALWSLMGLVGALGTYLAAFTVSLERRLKRMEGGPGLSRIVSQPAWYEDLIARMRAAHTSIDITHHEPRSPMISGIKAKLDLFGFLNRKIASTDVLVRYIIAINSSQKMEWAVQLIREHKDRPNFSLRYTPVDLDYAAPPQSIQLIDEASAFVIDMSKGHHSASGLDIDLFTEDPVVVQQLKRYYDSYWQRCVVLKEGSLINEEQIQVLKQKWN